MQTVRDFVGNIATGVSSNNLPSYNDEQASPYNLNTYTGRVQHMYTILNPLTLTYTSQQITTMKSLIQSYQSSFNKSSYDNKSLWEAKLVLSSSIHPDTKKEIFHLFRFSAFALTNIPICILLLMQGNINTQLFAQFINQSYNVAVNYSNRNASNSISNQKLLMSYIAAVSSSCGIAFGLRKYMANMSESFQKSIFARGIVPYSAIMLSSIINLYFIRFNEISEGISISIKKYKNNNNKNEFEYEKVGLSKNAGHIALLKCTAARAIWGIPPMFLPPMIMSTFFLKKQWWNGLKIWKKLMIEGSVIGGVLIGSMPPSLAVFPQMDNIKGKWLEKEFRDKYGDNQVFYFNKGL